MLNITKRKKFEDNCWVGLVDSSTFNLSPEHRIKAVTDIASITKGKLGIKEPDFFNGDYDDDGYGETDKYQYELDCEEVKKKRTKLYERLLTESAGSPSTPFEFVPTFYPKGSNVLSNYATEWKKYATEIDMTEHVVGRYYSNLRNDLIYYPSIIDNSNSMDSFKVIVGRIPIKVISHLRTHRAFSWLVESSRNRRYLNEIEFWYPSWWSLYYKEGVKHRDFELLEDLQTELRGDFIKPEEATMELSDRRLVHFAMAAWKQNPHSWDNLFAVRGKKTGTMSITGLTVDAIKELVEC